MEELLTLLCTGSAGLDPEFRKIKLVTVEVELDEGGTGSRETGENTGERRCWPELRQGP